jgi:negative regulator of flagellin synthesis FlgM
MSININNQTAQKQLVIDQNKDQAKLQKQKSPVEAERTQSVKSDSIQLTPQAQNLSKIQQGSVEPQFNSERVATLKLAIMNGEYKINAESLANKLVQFESDFGKAFPAET